MSTMVKMGFSWWCLVLSLAVIISQLPGISGECTDGNCGNDSTTIRQNINNYVDEILRNLTRVIKDSDNGKVNLPKIMPIPVDAYLMTCTFEADNGYFADLTTLARKGDAHLTKVGTMYTVNAGLTLGTAKIHYSHYKFACPVGSVNGHLTGTVHGVGLEFNISINLDLPVCMVSLNYIRFTNPGNLEMSMTGLGIFNRAASALIERFSRKWDSELSYKLDIKLSSTSQHSEIAVCETHRDRLTAIINDMNS